ncbi:hypothetical protein jhhlp_005647 [Lomentospora prolificans]|uniref:Protein ZIP4 homolog n=1 Tax=Lomentospora prolificans TaxID=41688 RepID=A0A2N3N3N4_9PEZI|nr:hypothetical protein jhhlp_005647 [Lomentospora prolificans]
MAHVTSLLKSCSDLRDRLPNSDDTESIETLLDDVKVYLRTAKTLGLKTQAETRPRAHELEEKGISLWNLCTRLRRNIDTDEDISADFTNMKKLLYLWCRVFSFFLIDIARRARGGEKRSSLVADLLYLLRLALKAARSCIEDGELELALGCLQKGVDYIKEVRGRTCPQEYDGEFRGLEAEYFILRIWQSWKEDRLDVAEHMYRKAEDTLKSLDPRPAENLCAVLFEIGRASLEQKDFSLATKWLERAYGVINNQELEDLSRNGVELRLTIVQAFIQALVGTGNLEDMNKARDIVMYMESDIGDKPVVLLMRLELLMSTPDEEFDTLAYADILRRMVKGFTFTRPHFQFFLSHARRLYKKGAVLGCNVLDELITGRLLGSGKGDWIGKALIMRVWMATSRVGASGDIVELEDLLGRIQDGLEVPIEPIAAAAAQSLIWKQVEANLTDEQYETADQWCRVAMHEVFHSAGPQNLAKISRKRILCALMRNQFDNAKQLYLTMPEATQREPMTRYLMFKVALRNHDNDLAVECLGALSNLQTKGRDFLYACVLDAQSVGSRRFAAAAMKSLVENHDAETASPIHLPALIRCTIRLLVVGLDPKSEEEYVAVENAANDICHMFEEAASAVQRAPRDADGKKLFTVTELDWFHQNAYNIGINRCETWDLRHTIRIFEACLSIMKQYPADIPLEDAKDLSLKAMCCYFIIGAALISLARREDVVDEKLRMYSEMRGHVARFEVELNERSRDIGKTVLEDLKAKLATLLIFDFEGAVALGTWDELAEVVRRAEMCGDAVAYKAMADCLLRAKGIPPQALFSTMRAIINQLCAIQGFGVERVAKYIRCLFQAVLPLEGSMAFQLADEALHLVREASTMDQRFPDEELEWLATMSWNHAIDFYSVGEDGECKKWAVKAINLAHYCNDERRLERNLQDRFSSLKWEEK